MRAWCRWSSRCSRDRISSRRSPSSWRGPSRKLGAGLDTGLQHGGVHAGQGCWDRLFTCATEGMLMAFRVGGRVRSPTICALHDVKIWLRYVHRHEARRSHFRCRQVAVNGGKLGNLGRAEDWTETGKLSHSREIGAKSASLLGFWFGQFPVQVPSTPQTLGRNPEGFCVFRVFGRHDDLARAEQGAGAVSNLYQFVLPLRSGGPAWATSSRRGTRTTRDSTGRYVDIDGRRKMRLLKGARTKAEAQPLLAGSELRVSQGQVGDETPEKQSDLRRPDEGMAGPAMHQPKRPRRPYPLSAPRPDGPSQTRRWDEIQGHRRRH